MPLSEELINVTFAGGLEGGLWYRLDRRFDLLIDAYEEEEIPPDRARSVADEIRAFAWETAERAEIRAELEAVAGFLESSAERSLSVWICL